MDELAWLGWAVVKHAFDKYCSNSVPPLIPSLCRDAVSLPTAAHKMRETLLYQVFNTDTLTLLTRLYCGANQAADARPHLVEAITFFWQLVLDHKFAAKTPNPSDHAISFRPDDRRVEVFIGVRAACCCTAVSLCVITVAAYTTAGQARVTAATRAPHPLHTPPTVPPARRRRNACWHGRSC
jgi:hypothetical protein